MAAHTPTPESRTPESRTARSLTAVAPDELEALRSELDRIDVSLLDALRLRIACCVEIALVKRTHGVPMMQPHRIGVVQRRAARYAEEHGLSAEFLRRLYDLVIAETCRVEDLVIDGSPAVPRTDTPRAEPPST
ncbi:chorismate mutase family protein [Streptacidiphilus sp. N1-12]|uniref:Chorismate mutase family protein n=2 Tax=Streptacidiphilus alkalitolerans TaxID=3342712 RepID=A0ABV6V7N1_9ACTN